MLTLGLGFLRHAWDPATRAMHNLMSYDRRWLDKPHTGDHVGRAAWALGAVIAARPPRAAARPSLRMLQEMLPELEALSGRREIAYTVLGLSRPATDSLPGPLQKLLRTLADRLAGWYADARRADWLWFEDELTYDNARLPQALIAAGHQLGDPAMLAAGCESLDWYAQQCGIDTPVVELVGNFWRRRGEPIPVGGRGDEQPLDAAALVEAHTEALAATGRLEYGHRAVRAFEWFFGRNRLGEPVYDFTTGGCHDGLGGTLNDNQGAESTLAFLQALLAIDEAALRVSAPQP